MAAGKSTAARRRPCRRHHREPRGLPAGPSGDGEGGRRGWWLVVVRGSAARVARGGGDAGASAKTDLLDVHESCIRLVFWLVIWMI
jgi:hypothetical protein